MQFKILAILLASVLCNFSVNGASTAIPNNNDAPSPLFHNEDNDAIPESPADGDMDTVNPNPEENQEENLAGPDLDPVGAEGPHDPETSKDKRFISLNVYKPYQYRRYDNCYRRSCNWYDYGYWSNGRWCPKWRQYCEWVYSCYHG